MGKRKRISSPWDTKAMFVIELCKNTEDQELLQSSIVEQLAAAYRQGKDDGARMEREFPRGADQFGR